MHEATTRSISLPDGISAAAARVLHPSSQAGLQSWVGQSAEERREAGGGPTATPPDFEQRLDEHMRGCHHCDRLSPIERDAARARALVEILRNLSRPPRTLPERVWKELRQ